jgi:hypothetical protein
MTILLSSLNSTHSPTICINSTLPPPSTLAHTANGNLTLRPRCALCHCTWPKTAISRPVASPKDVSTSKSRPARCWRISARVCAMAEAPVWAAEECRRVRVWGSGMFLSFIVRIWVSRTRRDFGRSCLPVRTEQHCVGRYEGFDRGGGHVWGCEEG